MEIPSGGRQKGRSSRPSRVISAVAMREREKISDLTIALLTWCANNSENISKKAVLTLACCFVNILCVTYIRMGIRNLERQIAVSAEFEVRGDVLGLYYLKHCKEEASKLGIFGWVKHGRRGTIVGVIQGPKSRIDQMIFWLTSRGSPGSRIEDCYLYNYHYLARPEYRGFSVRF